MLTSKEVAYDKDIGLRLEYLYAEPFYVGFVFPYIIAIAVCIAVINIVGKGGS